MIVWAALAMLQAGTVSVKLPAMRLANLVPKLAEATGRPLTVARDLQDEVLLIEVSEMPSGELLDKVARVATAEWVQTGDQLRLERPEALRRRREAEELALRADFFAKGIAKLRETVDKQGRFNPRQAKELADGIDRYYRKNNIADEGLSNDERWNQITTWDGIMEQTPAAFVARKLIANLDPALYLDLEDGDRRILDRRPNQSQKGLGALGDSIAAEFASAQTVWSNEVNRRGPRVRPGIIQGWDPFEHSEVPNREKLGVRVEASCYGMRDVGYQFSISFRNPSGSPITATTEVLAAEIDPTRFAPADFLDRKVRLDAPAAMQRHSELRKRATDRSTWPEEWKAELLKPTERDPLAYIAGPELSEVARLHERNVVALVPDAMAQIPIYLHLRDKVSEGDFWRMAITLGHLQVEDDGKTLTISSFEPITESRRRAPRAALGTLLASPVTSDGPTLDAWSQFELARTSNLRNLMLDWLFTLLGNSTVGPRSHDPVLMRLYASLSDAQRRQLRRGAEIPVGQLSARQKSLLETVVARRSGGSFVQSQERGEMTSIWRGSALLDVTDLIPLGIPIDATLSLSEKEAPTMVHRMIIEDRPRQSTMDLADFVEHFCVSRQNRLNPESGLNQYPPMAIGSRRYLTFQLRLDPETVIRRSLSDSKPPTSFVRFAALPTADRKRILDAIAAETARRQDDKAPTSRQSPPPL